MLILFLTENNLINRSYFIIQEKHMRLIVKRLSGFNTGNDKGYVIPIAQENDDFSITQVNPDDFPKNNQISISRDFSIIEEAYGPDELFYLNSYRDGWEKEITHQKKKNELSLKSKTHIARQDIFRSELIPLA